MGEARVKLNFRTPQTMKNRLDELARVYRRNTGENKQLTEQLNEAVEAYVEAQEKKNNAQ